MHVIQKHSLRETVRRHLEDGGNEPDKQVFRTTILTHATHLLQVRQRIAPETDQRCNYPGSAKLASGFA